MSFQNKAIKDKVLKAYNERIWNDIVLNKKTVDDIDKYPMVMDASRNDVLILTGLDAAGYKSLRKLNNISEDYKNEPIIKEKFLEAFMRASYIKKAQRLDFSKYSEKEILSGLYA